MRRAPEAAANKPAAWRPLRLLTRWAVRAALVAVSALVPCQGPYSSAAATGNSVPPEALPSLILGPTDLPWPAVLGDLTRAAKAPRQVLEFARQGPKFSEAWSGPVVSERHCLRAGKAICEDRDRCTCEKGPRYGVSVSFAITPTPQEAQEAAVRQNGSTAGITPEVTGSASVSSFADRAWYSDNSQGQKDAAPPTGGHLLFTRGNVVAVVSVGHDDGFDPKVIFALAARLGRKIDAAASGKPEAVPVLPLAADRELRVDVEGAWKLHGLGRRLWGDKATTIALYDTNGLPRSLPARQIEGGDYLVPLGHLLAIASPGARVKTRGVQATVSIAGKALVLEQGESEVRGGPRAVQLSRPAELAEGQVLVPLSSFARQVLGQGIAWGHAGTVPLGRLQ